jgi:hypothetical protein
VAARVVVAMAELRWKPIFCYLKILLGIIVCRSTRVASFTAISKCKRFVSILEFHLTSQGGLVEDRSCVYKLRRKSSPYSAATPTSCNNSRSPGDSHPSYWRSPM